MAILAIFTGIGISKQQYDNAIKTLDWEKEWPSGMVIHSSGFDDAGNAHAVDVWTSADALNEYVTKRLVPVMQRLNIPPPKVDIYPAHNINAHSNVSQFVHKK